MNYTHNSLKVILLCLIIMIAFGCKSSKKMEAAKAKEKARIEQEQEAKLRKQREEEAKQREADEQARREAEAKRLKTESSSEMEPQARLNDYFQAIASASNVTSANNSINEALALFSSPETPVLIVIHESAGQKDYDRPTTIKEYLHYLKDQKKNINEISNLKVDNSGKITEVELKKPL